MLCIVQERGGIRDDDHWLFFNHKCLRLRRSKLLVVALLNILKEFWITSYKTDRIAFYLEVFSVAVTIWGSALLTFTSPGPDMRLVFPLYLMGSTTLAYASYRRRIIWTCVLASWFTIMNVIGNFRVFL